MENYFSINLHFLRKTKGLNQTQMADIIGKKKSIIGPYERGEVEPDMSSLLQISEYFGISISDLIGKDLENDTTLEISSNVKEPRDKYVRKKYTHTKQENHLLTLLIRISNDIDSLKTSVHQLTEEIREVKKNLNNRH